MPERFLNTIDLKRFPNTVAGQTIPSYNHESFPSLIEFVYVLGLQVCASDHRVLTLAKLLSTAGGVAVLSRGTSANVLWSARKVRTL